MEARQVLTASYDWSDEPLQVSEIDGLQDAVGRVRDTHETELVRCEDRVADYDVYWNEQTGTVRIAAVVAGASYEVSEDND